jgi:hypothetical protein
MQQLWRFSPGSAYRSTVDAPLQLSVSGYGYGLGIGQECRFTYTVGHGGGLPGYGSLMRWLPEYGVGLIAMGNLTYGGFGGLFNDTINALHKTGALKPRVAQPSPALLKAQADISQLIIKWDDALANRITADNFFLDAPAEARRTRWEALTGDDHRSGECVARWLADDVRSRVAGSVYYAFADHGAEGSGDWDWIGVAA